MAPCPSEALAGDALRDGARSAVMSPVDEGFPEVLPAKPPWTPSAITP